MTLSGNKDKIKYSIGDVEYLSEELIQFIITIYQRRIILICEISTN